MILGYAFYHHFTFDMSDFYRMKHSVALCLDTRFDGLMKNYNVTLET